MEEGHVKVKERQEHEDQQQSSGEQHVTLGFVVISNLRYSSEQTSLFLQSLGIQQNQSSSNSHISGQELQIPENVISDGLKENNSCQKRDGDSNTLSQHDHADGNKLAEEVEDDKESGQEVSTAPGFLHELTLIIPLTPHSEAVLDKSGNETKAGNMGKVMLGVTDKLKVRNIIFDRQKNLKPKKKKDTYIICVSFGKPEPFLTGSAESFHATTLKTNKLVNN